MVFCLWAAWLHREAGDTKCRGLQAMKVWVVRFISFLFRSKWGVVDYDFEG